MTREHDVACSVVFSQACLCSINVDMYVAKRYNTMYDIYALLTESIRDRQPSDRSTHARTHIHAFVFTRFSITCSQFVEFYVPLFTLKNYLCMGIYISSCVYVYFVYAIDWHFAHRKRKHFKLSFRCYYSTLYFFDLFKSSWSIAYVTKEGVKEFYYLQTSCYG